MAQKRMLNRKIIQTDSFFDMPLSAQCLYFHLNLEADDDGFIANVNTIKRMIGASEDDLKLLCVKKFIIKFESGIVVIRDWLVHNTLKKDRYHETIFLKEKNCLAITDSKSYELIEARWFQNGSILEPQIRLELEEVSKDKISIDKYSIELDKEFSRYLDQNQFSYQKRETILKLVLQTKKSIEKKTNTKLSASKGELIACLERNLKYCDSLPDNEFSKYLNKSFSIFWEEKAIKLTQKNRVMKNQLNHLFSKDEAPDEEYFRNLQRKKSASYE